MVKSRRMKKCVSPPFSCSKFVFGMTSLLFLLLIVYIVFQHCWIKKKQCVSTREGYTIHTIRNDPNADYVDAHRPIKALCTDFVTTFCLPQPFLFLQTVVTSHQIAFSSFAKKYNIPEPIFCYKGGNLLLTLYRSFIQQFPEMSRKPLLEHFYSYFSPSDADFSVYYPPSQYTKDQMNELTDLCFQIQKELRNRFLKDKETYFAYFRYNASFKTQLLDKLQTDLNKLTLWSDPILTKDTLLFGKQVSAISFGGACTKKDCLPLSMNQGEEDQIIRFSTPDKTEIQVQKLGSPRLLFVQDNRALYFFKSGSPQQPTHFDLIRTKFSFHLQLSTPRQHLATNGELIDVSLSRNETYLDELWKKRKDVFVRYSLQFPSTTSSSESPQTVSVMGYTYPYFIEDLTRILYKDNVYPWSDEKYEKRLHRLMFLSFMELFLQVHTWFDYLKKVGEILAKWNDPSSLKRETSINNFPAWVFWRDHVSTQGLSFQQILLYTWKFRKSISSSSHPYYSQFQNYIKILLDDTLVFLNVYAEFKKYLLIGGQISEISIYQQTI